MTNLSVSEIVALLREQGHEVETYQRKATKKIKGTNETKRVTEGLRITRIDGQEFSPSSSLGNRLGRQMTGSRLSRAQVEQRQKARKKVTSPLTPRQKRRLQKINRQIAKSKMKPFSMRKARQWKKHGHLGEYMRRAREVERHSKGFAYAKYVDWAIEQFTIAGMNKTADWLKNHRHTVKDDVLLKALQNFQYHVPKRYTSEQADSLALQFLKLNN